MDPGGEGLYWACTQGISAGTETKAQKPVDTPLPDGFTAFESGNRGNGILSHLLAKTECPKFTFFLGGKTAESLIDKGATGAIEPDLLGITLPSLALVCRSGYKWFLSLKSPEKF